MTLGNIVQFATGATCILPLGLDTMPKITFFYDSSITLPAANTCSLTLKLPATIDNPDVFKRRVTYGIFNSIGFGCT